jgi:hypothetical protein
MEFAEVVMKGERGILELRPGGADPSSSSPSPSLPAARVTSAATPTSNMDQTVYRIDDASDLEGGPAVGPVPGPWRHHIHGARMAGRSVRSVRAEPLL